MDVPSIGAWVTPVHGGQARGRPAASRMVGLPTSITWANCCRKLAAGGDAPRAGPVHDGAVAGAAPVPESDLLGPQLIRGAQGVWAHPTA